MALTDGKNATVCYLRSRGKVIFNYSPLPRACLNHSTGSSLPFVLRAPNLSNKCLALCVVSRRTHVGVCTRARRLEVSRAFLRHSQPDSLTQGLSLNTLIKTTRLDDYTAVSDFYVSAGCSNTGPRACKAGAYQLNHHLMPSSF